MTLYFGNANELKLAFLQVGSNITEDTIEKLYEYYSEIQGKDIITLEEDDVTSNWKEYNFEQMLWTFLNYEYDVHNKHYVDLEGDIMDEEEGFYLIEQDYLVIIIHSNLYLVNVKEEDWYLTK